MITPVVAGLLGTLVCLGIGFRFTPWGRRTSRWLSLLFREKVDASPTKFSEWVSFAGFGLTIVGVSISWYTVSQQNQKAMLENRIKELTDQIGNTQQRLGLESRRYTEFAPNVDIHLTYPIRDVSVIGSRLNLEWKFAQHTDRLSYLIQLLKADRPDLPLRPPTLDSDSCDFSKYRSCVFYATAPGSERSQLSIADIPESEGQYLWRVVPAKKPYATARAEDSENVVSDWSEYGSFSYYRSLISRITRTSTVLVGTTYSDNVNFSSLDASGSHRGHDVDLIRLLIEGCLVIEDRSKRVSFDGVDCKLAVDQYRQKQVFSERPPAHLKVDFKPFISVGEGLDALARKEVDVFIGSLTKAQERENDAVILTDGYYSFRSALCAHPIEKVRTLATWLRTPKRVGVIDNSTNHWLATLLSAEPDFQNKISIVAFDSFPSLQSGFESRQVDGVLVDNVLIPKLGDQARTHSDTWIIDGLDRTSAWQRYHARLGTKEEEFAIAVATDREQSPSSRSAWLNVLFSLDLVRSRTEPSQMSLFEPIQVALHSHQIVAIRSLLRTVNQLPPEPIDKVSFSTEW